MAEFIDFFLLFVLKLGVTIVVVEYMGLMYVHLDTCTCIYLARSHNIQIHMPLN